MVGNVAPIFLKRCATYSCVVVAVDVFELDTGLASAGGCGRSTLFLLLETEGWRHINTSKVPLVA